jgi:uncharacterized protein (TIGR02453 family)
MHPFSGIDPAAPAFFARLAAENHKDHWHAHLDEYRATVRAPFEALLDDLSGAFGPWRTFRPQRDTRFSRDKSPYKTWISGVTLGQGGTVYSLRLDRHGLRVGSGYPWMAADQLARFRAAIDDDASGEAFLACVAAVEGSGDAGPRVTGGRLERLKTAPRGYPRTHPRVGWLQVKGVEIALALGVPDWLATPDATTEILRRYQLSRPVTDWLDAHVGPTRLPPDPPRRRR